jgi:ribonuclease HI
MELLAAVSALEAVPAGSTVQLHTDSSYLQRGMSEWAATWARKGWRRGSRPIPNADLWQRLVALNQERQVEWRWIRGHGGNPGNELAHRLATAARDGATVPEERRTAAEETAVAVLALAALCPQQPGPGAWGAVLDGPGERQVASGAARSTTLYQMELVAAVHGLALAPAGAGVLVMTTSEYLLQGATAWIHRWRNNGWRTSSGREVRHRDLWEELSRVQGRLSATWRLATADQESALLAQASSLASAALRAASDVAAG